LLRPEERFDSFDLAHAQHWLSAGATTAAAGKLGVPVVVTVRDYWPVCIWSTKLSGDSRCPGCSYGRRVVCVGRRYPALWPASLFLPYAVDHELRRRQENLRNARSVVAVSRFVQKTLPIDGSTVIPNLIEFTAIEESLSGPVPSLPERFVLFVGKLETNKAPDRALSVVGKARVDVPLLMAGAGSMERSLREQAKRLNVDARFLGWVSESMIHILMQRASAVVFPSRWEEPLSRVLLEGLGTGALLIVEPTGGSEEIVVDGESGLLARTEEDMAAALRMALEEKDLVARLRRGALQRARERFSSEVVLPQLESLYEKVMTRR
jgi:glycosyltransferase involved in cell wall biosynthesis